MPGFRQRISKVFAKYGLFGSIVRMITKPFRLAHYWLPRFFFNYNYVLKFDPAAPRTAVPEGFSVCRIDRPEDIPPALLEKMRSCALSRSLVQDQSFVKNKGCTLWLALFNDEIACKAVSRDASAISKWFVPLAPGDQVCMRVYTIEKYRGKGISPALTQHIALSYYDDRGSGVYSDCSIHNKASIRSFQKAGFAIVEKMRPITED
jgi:hypothetical protein